MCTRTSPSGMISCSSFRSDPSYSPIVLSCLSPSFILPHTNISIQHQVPLHVCNSSLDNSSMTIMYIPSFSLPSSSPLPLHPLFLSSLSLLLTRPSHTYFQIRASDKIALAVAANTSITLRRAAPSTQRDASAVASRLKLGQNLALNKTLQLLHTRKVQTSGRERRECKKKKTGKIRENENLNYDSRIKPISVATSEER